MKIVCSKADLMKGINIVNKAVPSKTTMTILECILIDASAGQIRFTANDMELGIETVVEGQILSRGIAALEARLFSEIIRKLPDSDVTIMIAVVMVMVMMRLVMVMVLLLLTVVVMVMMMMATIY